MAVIDHLVYAVPDLDASIDWFELTTGIRPVIGGSHPNMGTRNALASFGESYLEIIGPDPRQPEPESGRPFGVVIDMEPKLVTFAARSGRGETIESLAAAAAYSGSDPGEIVDMSRTPPGRDTLTWRLTMPVLTHDGVIPFLIDWGATTHPSASAPTGLRLERLEGATTDTATVESVLTALHLNLPITPGDGGLTASIASPQGNLVLT